MKYRYLVIDDEPLARKLVISHASRIEVLDLAGECTDAIEANNFLAANVVDLLFLDIQMPQMDGFQLINILKNPPPVIITTAFRNFAPEAYDFDVVDYLLKPISFERFMKSVNKFLDRKSSTAVRIVEHNEESFVYIRADRKIHKVALEEIIYIESLDDYIKVHLKNKVLISRENISTIEGKLHNRNFVRIHRSFIVAVKHITSISNDGIEINGIICPFGRAYKHSAMAALGIR
jgi:DNA-binding LytR/AlgR family response regulator